MNIAIAVATLVTTTYSALAKGNAGFIKEANGAVTVDWISRRDRDVREV